MFDRCARFRFADSLHAEAALLHDALSANGDVRIELPVERLWERVLLPIRLAVAKPVEVANLVRAVVRAIPRADAPVVDLHVQAVGRVIRRIDRANRLTRRVAAMLAQHGHEPRLELLTGFAVWIALEIPLETNPVHLAAALDVEAGAGVGEKRRILPERTNRRNVVLGVTRRDTCRAARAAREVDRHRPATLRHAARVVRAIHAL